ncbi:uncharacterized protein LOC143556077 [Bidens hawaiensis]|uniref:uncharacterized protein LOC143556077 n=1 Tax=Bidens hawaiensis TaxID=980011 RepID=UPI0040494556
MEAQIDAIVNNFKSINIQQHNNQKSNHFWSNWGRKQKKNTVASSHKVPRVTQSEVADYGFGRRSCDITGPRFSLDIRSLEEEEEGSIPTQTQTPREYYFNSSSKGLIQRSTSMRAPSVSVINNNNNQNATKVSPASMDIYNRTHPLKFHSIGGENELETDDSSVNKKTKKTTRWWRNLKVKLWGSGNNTRIRKLTRSSSSVSWINNKPQRDDFRSDKNNPPPNHVNNGFLRFYLTPLRASRRSGTGAFMSSKAC